MQAAIIAVACLLLSAACSRPTPPPEAFATEEECAALVLVAKQELKLHKANQPLLHGMDRQDWAPTCDWEAASINFLDTRDAVGFSGIGVRGPDVTFYRPKLDRGGAVITVETVDDIGEEITTCKLRRYGANFSVAECKVSYVTPM